MVPLFTWQIVSTLKTEGESSRSHITYNQLKSKTNQNQQDCKTSELVKMCFNFSKAVWQSFLKLNSKSFFKESIKRNCMIAIFSNKRLTSSAFLGVGNSRIALRFCGSLDYPFSKIMWPRYNNLSLKNDICLSNTAIQFWVISVRVLPNMIMSSRNTKHLLCIIREKPTEKF